MVVDTKSMKAKKTTQVAPSAKEKEKQMSRAVHFFGEIKSELKRITWTPKDELWIYTKIVVTTTVCLGLAIYFVDLGIQSVLDGLRGVVRFVGG